MCLVTFSDDVLAVAIFVVAKIPTMFRSCVRIPPFFRSSCNLQGVLHSVYFTPLVGGERLRKFENIISKVQFSYCETSRQIREVLFLVLVVVACKLANYFKLVVLQ